MYNCGAFIEKTLDSIKSQVHKDIEIILVNDGSKDNTEEVVKEYIKNNKDVDIKYFLIENSGPGKARNVGLEHATGDFLCFLDSDDQYDVNLFKDLEAVLDKDTDICYFGWIEIDEQGKPFSYYDSTFKFIDNKISGLEASKKKFHKELWLCNCNEVYRLEFLKKNNIKYIEGVFSGEDTNFIYKCLLQANVVSCLPKNYFLNTYRNDSLMHHDFSERYLTEFKALEELYSFVKERNYDEEIIRMIFSLYYYARIAVAKKMVKSIKGSHPFKCRKMIKTMIPKLKKEMKPILTKKEKVECGIYGFSKFIFFYFVKMYYATHKK